MREGRGRRDGGRERRRDGGRGRGGLRAAALADEEGEGAEGGEGAGGGFGDGDDLPTEFARADGGGVEVDVGETGEEVVNLGGGGG